MRQPLGSFILGRLKRIAVTVYCQCMMIMTGRRVRRIRSRDVMRTLVLYSDVGVVTRSELRHQEGFG